MKRPTFLHQRRLLDALRWLLAVRPRPISTDTASRFDVFISYNSLDHAAVERIGRALEERGLTVFLDRWELVAGRS